MVHHTANDLEVRLDKEGKPNTNKRTRLRRSDDKYTLC